MTKYKTMITAQDWKLKLLQAKSGMPIRFAYISEIREMHPDLNPKQVAHLHAIWNGRVIQQKENKDPFWGVKLLIDICHHVKNNIQK